MSLDNYHYEVSVEKQNTRVMKVLTTLYITDQHDSVSPEINTGILSQ